MKLIQTPVSVAAPAQAIHLKKFRQALGATLKTAPVALMPLIMLGAIVLQPQSAQAANWVKVTENAAKDKFFIDASSIKRSGNTVTYWEYREFLEPNNPFLENSTEKPLYGVVIRWTGDCGAKTQRLRRVNAFSKNRELLQRFDYGEKGTLSQPRPGSSGYEVLETACNPKRLESTEKPATKPGEAKPIDVKPGDSVEPKKP